MAKATKEQVAARKDRRVKRSSHGKFLTVKDLVAHQAKVSRQPRPRPVERFEVEDNWLSRDGRFQADVSRDYMKKYRGVAGGRLA